MSQAHGCQSAAMQHLNCIILYLFASTCVFVVTSVLRFIFNMCTPINTYKCTIVTLGGLLRGLGSQRTKGMVTIWLRK